MSEAPDKPLIAARRLPAIGTGTRLGRILAKLHAARVVYRYRPGSDLTGSGQFMVEVKEGHIRCRVLGDLFNPNPFEFAFHRFWLTRRGMILAVFDLAEDRPPETRAKSESFLHFTNLHDHSIRREAAAFRDRPMSGKKRKPS